MIVCVTRCVAIARRPASDGWRTTSEKPRILVAQHDRSAFESGVEPLDRYFRVQAGQDARKNMAAPFVLVLSDGAVAGYYTLSSTAVNLGELPATAVRKLPRWWRRSTAKGKGYGRFLLADALFRAVRSKIAYFALVVDARDGHARRFYERESFLPFPDQPMKLFRPMADMERLFK